MNGNRLLNLTSQTPRGCKELRRDQICHCQKKGEEKERKLAHALLSNTCGDDWNRAHLGFPCSTSKAFLEAK